MRLIDARRRVRRDARDDIDVGIMLVVFLLLHFLEAR
jgi:hypothetical protein